MANSGSFRKGEKRPNQGKHGPPKATVAAREAIGMFVEGNAHRLQAWLDQIAEHDPEKAFTLFQSVIEYHIPKLARSDVNATVNGTLVVQATQHDERI